MITINDEMKQSLSRFLDSDGKIIVSDDMPDDLKAAINYLNANNVNLLEETKKFADDNENENEDEDDEMMDSSVSSSSSTIEQNIKISEDQNIETADLEQLF